VTSGSLSSRCIAVTNDRLIFSKQCRQSIITVAYMTIYICFAITFVLIRTIQFINLISIKYNLDNNDFLKFNSIIKDYRLNSIDLVLLLLIIDFQFLQQGQIVRLRFYQVFLL
jgi:hypothetical protein